MNQAVQNQVPPAAAALGVQSETPAVGFKPTRVKRVKRVAPSETAVKALSNEELEAQLRRMDAGIQPGSFFYRRARAVDYNLKNSSHVSSKGGACILFVEKGDYLMFSFALCRADETFTLNEGRYYAQRHFLDGKYYVLTGWDRSISAMAAVLDALLGLLPESPGSIWKNNWPSQAYRLGNAGPAGCVLTAGYGLPSTVGGVDPEKKSIALHNLAVLSDYLSECFFELFKDWRCTAGGEEADAEEVAPPEDQKALL